MQFTLTGKLENGSEQQLELGKATTTILFNIVLKQIMNGALDNHVGSVNIGGKIITNLRFRR